MRNLPRIAIAAFGAGCLIAWYPEHLLVKFFSAPTSSPSQGAGIQSAPTSRRVKNIALGQPSHAADQQSLVRQMHASFVIQADASGRLTATLPTTFHALDPSSGRRFQQIMRTAIAQKLHQRPMGEIMQIVAQQFLGTPYRADSLDQASQEQLILSLEYFDCVTFVETVLAIARGIAAKDYSYQAFASHMLDQRYRDGRLNGYCSRLHYFSEWITDNQSRGTVITVSDRFRGGVVANKPLNFISQHRSRYPLLATHDQNYQCILRLEANLNSSSFSYIPKHQVTQFSHHLKPGDIVAIATNIPGLDVSHTGLIFRQPDGSLGLIHASPSGMVKISPRLSRYLRQTASHTGIIVARATGMHR